MSPIKSALLAAAAISLAGCVDKTIAPQVENASAFQEERLDMVRLENAGFKRHTTPFISGETYEEPEPLPGFLRKQVYLNATRPLSLKYYVSNLSMQIGKPVRVGQDIYTVDTIVTEQLQDSSSNIDTSSVDGSSIIDSLITDNQKKQSPLAMQEVLKLQGSAEQALNTIASAFNIHWKYTDSDVTLYKLDTRTFRLDLQTKEIMNAKFEGATTTDTEGGMSTSLTSEVQTASFESYQETIASMLSPYGSAHVLGNSGAVIVTDTPEKLDAVDRFLKVENRHLTSQVALDIEVVRVTSTDNEDIGVVWDSLLADLGELAISGVSRRPTLSNSPVNEISTNVNSGRLTGSKVILQALSSKARVQVMTRETRTVLNNIPAVLRDISIKEYPSETTQTVNEGVTTFSTTKATIRPGFDMSLTPRILEDNRVILQLVTTMSRDLPFEDISSGDFTQRFAQLTQKEFKTSQVIKEGETAMLTGYINKNLSSTSEGTGRDDFWALGGGQASGKGKDLLVIFVTPYISRG
ncbi:hypothetical protein [Neptuniibacter halophilus]|uniref:hypothetical protein n=1 Tax=Neptuniibacter halophilus TaxID=651666 RepID=UPI0025733ADC|nr:hypothetical protein [Neptuniibacter halophilus]